MQEQIGRFQVLKRLGGGGFGEVYLGRDDMLGRDVAIKIFKPKDDNLIAFATSTDDEGYEVLKARFLNEARILSQLENATYVVSVLDFGELDDGSPYYVMPFLNKSLSDLIGKDVFDAAAIGDLSENEKPRALPLASALQYIQQLIEAVAAAHKKQLIHRDIKPANIMLNEEDEVRLVDFGIAKAPEGQHSTVSQLGIGSRNYMAPEQKESAKHVDTRADIYAIGVVVYRVITGRLPTGRYSDPNVFAPELAQGLNDLILDCLQEERSRRPNDAQTLLQKWEKATAEQNTPTNDESTGTWVGEGTSGLKDEIKPLREYIINLLNTHAEIPEEEKDQLDALAAVADLDQSGLQALIEECQQSLQAQLKPKQNLLKLIDSKVQDNTLDTEATRSAIYKAGESIGWSSEELDTIIERKRGGAKKAKSPGQEDTQGPSANKPKLIGVGVIALIVLAVIVGGVMTGEPDPSDTQTTAQAEPTESAKQAPITKTEPDQAPEAAGKYPAKFRTTPAGAVVTIDGAEHYSGKVYLTGTYPITVKKDGYAPYSGRITITNNMATKRITLDAIPQAPSTYGITVNATPSDATVKILTIGSKYTPGIQVEPGQHTIVVSKAGYETYRQSINVNKDQYLNITLKRAERQAGDTFKDCSNCPEMVVIPSGSFQMGSHDGVDDENPVHKVNIQSFSMSKTEVTKGQFAAFVDATGYRTDAEKNTGGADGCYALKSGEWDWRAGYSWRSPGFNQSNSHPVVCVSYYDAKAYTKWLSQRTGKSYGLPSEAQWEYAARAGSTTKYHFGNTESSLCRNGNGHDKTASKTFKLYAGADCDDGYANTAPVQNYRPNDFGLYDMHGNVWEWVQDCWHGSYRNAPTDGRAWENANRGDCTNRVLRGGSWFSLPNYLRSAYRYRGGSAGRIDYYGFRLVQGG